VRTAVSEASGYASHWQLAWLLAASDGNMDPTDIRQILGGFDPRRAFERLGIFANRADQRQEAIEADG
jgi:hypothetical protein